MPVPEKTRNRQKAFQFSKKTLAFIIFLSGILLAGTTYNPDKQDSFSAYSEPLAGSGQSLQMVPVKGGTFTMGSNKAGAAEAPEHQVEVADFWMAAYEITWDQYAQFSEEKNLEYNTDRGDEVRLEVDGIASATTPYVDMSHGMGKKDHPVINVTQHAALTFCKWLSAKTGRFYRLPTEAEWEYACRAGNTGEYSFGDDASQIDEYAWHRGNSEKAYKQVGLKKPNAFGLYDMHGNVAEWTMDEYDPQAYASRPAEGTVNPWIVPTKLYPRTVRGGSWQDDVQALRSAARTPSEPKWKRIDPQIPKSRWWFTNAPHVGFRIIRPKITPTVEEQSKYWLEAIDDY